MKGIVNLTKLQKIAREAGVKGLLSFTLSKMFGNSVYSSYCSTINLRNAGIPIAKDIRELFSVVGIPLSSSEFLEFSQECENIKYHDKIENNIFPKSYDSNQFLRQTLYTATRLLKPGLVVEVGTGNGRSATSVGSALKKNDKGKLLSLDLIQLNLNQLDVGIKEFVIFKCLSDASERTKRTEIEKHIKCNPGNGGIFLHDGDHSFFGQTIDFNIAYELGFNVLISDDVDASLAFLKFVSQNKLIACVLLDGNRFIGIANLRKE